MLKQDILNIDPIFMLPNSYWGIKHKSAMLCTLVDTAPPPHPIKIQFGVCQQAGTAGANIQGPVLLTLLQHVARILANGRAAFFESCDAIGWNSCDVSQKR